MAVVRGVAVRESAEGAAPSRHAQVLRGEGGGRAGLRGGAGGPEAVPAGEPLRAAGEGGHRPQPFSSAPASPSAGGPRKIKAITLFLSPNRRKKAPSSA